MSYGDDTEHNHTVGNGTVAVQGSGFTLDHITFKNIHSEGHKYTGGFICSASQPCKDFTLEDITLVGSKEWTCRFSATKDKHGTGCDCFTKVDVLPTMSVTPKAPHCS